MKMGDKAIEVETISSGSLGIDLALSWWISTRRIIEIYGPESSEKQP
jgi:recombination protein RecA